MAIGSCLQQMKMKNIFARKRIQDSMHFEMTHLGIVCTYTKSNSTKFYFDDIYCDEIYIDKEPPYIDSLYIDDEKQTIGLYFNESLDSISALILELHCFPK